MPEDRLDHVLAELRIIAKAEADLKAERAKYTEEAIPLLRERGSVRIVDPIDGSYKLANVTQTETMKVDAGKLLAVLNEVYDDEDMARAIWQDCLKDPEVDSKIEGRFEEVVKRHKPEEGMYGFPQDRVHEVATFKKASAYVNFSKAGG